MIACQPALARAIGVEETKVTLLKKKKKFKSGQSKEL